MKSFEPTVEQRKVIEHRGSHMLVFAGPGTGKTETLARRFASIVYDDGIASGNILVLTFSRRAADAMRERIVLRMRERSGKGIAVPELHVYTFHGFCRRLLDGGRPRRAHKDLLTPVKERLLWNHVLEGCKLRTFAEDVTRSTAFATAVLNWIAHLKGNGVTPDAFANETGGDERLIDLAQLYRLMDEQRSRLGLSDFRDLVADAVRELADPCSVASSWVRSRAGFRHVLVDEFQDSDLMQLQLLEALGGETLFANPPQPEMCFVGDFNQSIYRFRGADPDNIVRAKERFSCQEFELRLNRRSVQAVLDVANRTPRLHPESLTVAEADRSERGSARLLRTQTADGEITAIADAVADRVRSGTSPGDVAVLLRVVEPYRGAIARELEARGIPVAAQSTAGYHEDSLIDAVRTCIRIVAGERDAAIWKRLLTNPVVGFRPLSVSLALETDPSFSGDPRRALEARPPKGRLGWADFSSRLERCRDAGGPPFKFSPAALIEGIVRELDLLWPIRENRDVPGFDPAASPARLEALIEAAHDLRETFANLGGPRMSAASFLDVLDDVFALLGDPYEGPQAGAEGVAVMSIHAAKGLEFDFVVVPQLIDGVLPARARPDQLLGTRRSRFARDIEDAALEEASLWYVAVTRARFDVLATAARMDDDATEQALSQFAYLIDENDRQDAAAAGRLEPAGFANAYAAAGEAERRRAPVVQYIAARPVLGAFLRAGELIDEPARSLTWEIERLSPSGIERYVECPRRWFYQDVLRLSADDEDTTRMGRFVHKVLERYHQTETDFSNVAARELTAGSIIAALAPLAEEEARRAATECGLSTDSSMFRYEVARVRRHLGWYATWLLDEARAQPFVVLACEQPIGIALGAFRLVGKVDRIDRLADGTLVIRDYKTGRLRTKTCGKAVAAAFGQIDPSAPGIGLFGDAPDGLKLQTLLYVRGVEALFGGRVARADYLYLAGSASDGSEETCVDSVAFADDVRQGAHLNRGELDAVYDVIAASVAREVSEGSLHGFPTALDESTCRYCPYTAVCPGPGTVTYDDVAVALARQSAAQLRLDLNAS